MVYIKSFNVSNAHPNYGTFSGKVLRAKSRRIAEVNVKAKEVIESSSSQNIFQSGQNIFEWQFPHPNRKVVILKQLKSSQID